MWRPILGVLFLVLVLASGYLGARFLFGADAAVFFTLMSTLVGGVVYRSWARRRMRERANRAGDEPPKGHLRD